MNLRQAHRVDAAVHAIAAIDVPGLRTKEMLAALGYLTSLIILTDRHPDQLLTQFIDQLDRDVRSHITTH